MKKIFDMLTFKFKAMTIKFKVITFAIVALVVGLLVIWFLSKQMTTTAGAINVTKITEQDKIYSYSVYGDFYYRLQQFDKAGNEETQYSELIPVATNLGYDLSKEPVEAILSAQSSTNAIRPFDGKGLKTNANRFLNELKKFSSKYGKIIATLDQHYFDELERVSNSINQDLFQSNSILPSISKDEFYEPTINTRVDNLILDVFKLDYINSNLKDQGFNVCEKKWCPYLVQWLFNEKDKVSLKVIDKLSFASIDEYIQKQIDDKMFKEQLLISTIKPTIDGIEKIYLEVDLRKNQIINYFMDDNGYIYKLEFEASHVNALYNGLEDYMKLVYSINFINVRNFNNDYFAKQEKVKEKVDDIISIVRTLQKNLEKMNERKLSLYTNSLNSKERKIYDAVLSTQNFIGKSVRYKTKELYEIFETIPNQLLFEKIKLLDNISKRLKNELQVADEILQDMHQDMHEQKSQSFIGRWFSSNEDMKFLELIAEKCDNLECIIEKNKNKDW